MRDNHPEAEKFFAEHFLKLKERMQQGILAGKSIYPSAEVQATLLKKMLDIPCAWRALVNMAEYTVSPLISEDGYFPFHEVISIENLITYIHPDYLIPFLLAAEFAYTFTIELNISPEDIPEYTFQVSVPFKFPKDDDYFWYTQASSTISINEYKAIVTHSNIYSFEKRFDPSEHKLVHPSVLKKGRLFHSFHEGLVKKLRFFLVNSLTANEQKVITLYAKGYKLKAVAGDMGTTEGTERVRNNNILKKVKKIIGFKFGSIAELSDFLNT